MSKLTFLKKGVRLADEALEYFKRSGINVPEKTKFCDALRVSRGKQDISIYSFRDGENYLMKRLKITEDSVSGDKQVQARFYEHLGEKGGERKLSRVSAFDFGKDNRCSGGTAWDFYYPYESKSVWFAKHSSGTKESVNNFPKISDYVEDANGFRLKPISIAEYLDTKKTLGRKNYVDEPWTLKQSITEDTIATDCIRECTVVGIKGKNGVTINHLNPNNPENYDLKPVADALAKQIQAQGKDAKAFMLGSVEIDTKSNYQFWKLYEILEKMGIPFSAYKTGDSVIQELVNMMPRGFKFAKEISNGKTTPFYFYSSQHIVCRGNEIKIANPLIDKELASGNRNASDMIKKSFGVIE